VTANVTPFAVIQVKPGIGDVIWHLPFIRAIAAAAPERQVTFFAPPTSAAKELLAAEPCVAVTVYFQHAGSELQRGLNLIRLVTLLRRHRLQSIWILDRTIRPALAAALAGIPERIGLGLGPQSAFITNRGIGQEHFHDHPIDWLRALMAEMKVPSTEPDLQLLSKPGELEPVFQAVLENAVRICEAKFANLFLTEGDAFRNVALYGAPRAFEEARRKHPLLKLSTGTALDRMAATKSVAQTLDAQTDPSYRDDPQRALFLQQSGGRTVVCIPLMKEDDLVGGFSVYRQEVRPFTEKQILTSIS
jgi:ADP-heptose:LPS heptosyltransferase